MATDEERLVLSVSADTRQILRQLKTLVGQTQRDTKAIEAAFGGIDQAAAGAFNGVAANSNRAFTTAEQGARRFGNAMNASRVQTSNLAAQLNDIGVQLAGGQSPFLIALQQGTQINQVLGQGGARAAVGALAGAFTSLVNPVSLATIAIISLGGAAVQYFTSLLSDSDNSAEALEKQAQLIRNVAKEWGDAVPALRDYVAELDKVKSLEELGTATKSAIGQVLEESLSLLPQVRDAAVEAMTSAANSTLETRTAYAQLIADMADVESAVDELNSAYQNGEDTTAAMERVNQELADVFNSSVIPATGALRELIDQLAGAYSNAAGQAGNLAAQAQAAAVNASKLPALGTLTPLESVNGQLTGDTIAIQNARAEATKSQTQIEAEKAAGSSRRSSGGGSRAGAISEAEREREAVADLIEQLEFEQSTIGMTDAERAEANALRRAGAAATEEQKARISELVEATYAERDALKASKEAMEELQAIGRDVLQGIVSDLREGKKGADILANALGRIADKLLSSALDGIFSGTGAAGGKGLFGGAIIPGILHSGGVAGRDGYGHSRAVSPSVFAGARRYHKGGIAGLVPGEVPAILQKGEVVLPRGAKTAAGGVSAPVSIAIDARGADEAGLARVERQIVALKASLPGTVVKTVKDAQARRAI